MQEGLVNTFKKYRNLFLGGVALLLSMLALIIGLSLSSGKKVPVEEASTTATIKFVMPISNATIYKGFDAENLQYNKTLNCWEIHKALDLLATSGDSVLACYDGVVSDIYSNYLEGTTIEITHTNGLVSVYCGLNSETQVKMGDSVLTGQVIGSVASSLGLEADDGSHVHFELLQDGEKIDPLNYIEIGLKD